MPHYKRNITREEMIKRHGITAALPLFDQKAPDYVQERINHAPAAVPMATDTRRISYLAIQMKVGEEQKKVLDAFCSVPDGTNKEIADQLKIDASTVSARNNELRKLGLIVFSKKRQCSITKNIVTAWKVNNNVNG